MRIRRSLILFTSTFLFLVFTSTVVGVLLNSPAQAKCVRNPITGKQVCDLQDLDPTTGIPGSAEIAEKAWGTAGRAAYPAAAQTMKARNNGRPAKSLSAAHKRLLKARYGSLVDNVRVVYNATTMDKWCALGKCVQAGGVESAAQTYGDIVYVTGPERPIDINQFLLLAHELKHVQQQKGRLDTFGYDYFKAYKQAGQNYANNRMEKEAEAEANWFAQRVICPSTGCQWR
jgi:hypothetical protein